MAARVIALVGSGKGPSVCVQGIKNPHLHLSKPVDAPVIVRYDGKPDQMFLGPGPFPLEQAAFLSLEYLGESAQLICSVASGA